MDMYKMTLHFNNGNQISLDVNFSNLNACFLVYKQFINGLTKVKCLDIPECGIFSLDSICGITYDLKTDYISDID